MSISTVSFRVVSLMAMVPDRECRMPTLIVSAAQAVVLAARIAAPASAVADRASLCFMFICLDPLRLS
jgi:hypothetical protein